jgi:hypothetical protein
LAFRVAVDDVDRAQRGDFLVAEPAVQRQVAHQQRAFTGDVDPDLGPLLGRHDTVLVRLLDRPGESRPVDSVVRQPALVDRDLQDRLEQ